MTHSLSNKDPRDASASKKTKTYIHTQKLKLINKINSWKYFEMCSSKRKGKRFDLKLETYK